MSRRRNKSGDYSGRPGVRRTRQHRVKPCAVCGRPISRPYPSQLVRVKACRPCKGAYLVLVKAERRNQRLLAKWRQYPPEIRLLIVTAFREGARSTAERLRIRARGRALAALRAAA